MSGRAVSTALLITSASSTRERRSSILPRLMREMSSRSSIRRTMWPSWRSIISRAWATALGVAGREPHHLQAVAQRCQRIAQLVRQEREELVLAAVRLAQRLLRPLPLGDVAGDLGRADDPAATVSDRRDGQGYVDSAVLLCDPDGLESARSVRRALASPGWLDSSSRRSGGMISVIDWPTASSRV